jgi:hypothetical protein
VETPTNSFEEDVLNNPNIESKEDMDNMLEEERQITMEELQSLLDIRE